MEVTKEHESIMEHTMKNGLFCGDSQEIRDLCSLKLMKPVGKKSFVPDPYFAITQEGKEYLSDCHEVNRDNLSPHKSKREKCRECGRFVSDEELSKVPPSGVPWCDKCVSGCD